MKGILHALEKSLASGAVSRVPEVCALVQGLHDWTHAHQATAAAWSVDAHGSSAAAAATAAVACLDGVAGREEQPEPMAS
eukprot:16610-Chlamydomonas_euryale.AAC.3